VTTVIDEDEILEDTTTDGQLNDQMDNVANTTSNNDEEMETQIGLNRSTVTVNGMETQLSTIHQSATILQHQQTPKSTSSNIAIRQNPHRSVGRPTKYQK
jgi:hypothetical protein